MGVSKKYLLVAFYTLIAVVASTTSVAGQTSYFFRHLTTEDGLSNSDVKAILKDSKGFLWVGTESGLNRYDGYEFKAYTRKKSDSNSLETNNVSEILEDGMGNLWLKGYSYILYNRERDNFITDPSKYLKGLGIKTNGPFKVHVDKNKDLWIFDKTNVSFYDIKRREVKNFKLNTRFGDVVGASVSDDGEFVYSYGQAGVLWQLNKRTGHQLTYSLRELPDAEAYDRIYVDSQSGVWLFSTKSNFIYYKKTQGAAWKRIVLKPLITPQSNRVHNFLDDGNGHIYIGTDHCGLFIYDRLTQNVTNLIENPLKSSSLASNNVSCLYVDKTGVLWLGHYKKGISYYHSSFDYILNVDDPLCRDVSCFLEDRQGNLWLGTDGFGLFVRGVDGKIKKNPIGNSPVVSLMQDKRGRIWISTFQDGLYRMENNKFQRFTKYNSALEGDDIWDLVEDRFGNVWFGDPVGGIKYLPNAQESMDSLVVISKEMNFPLDLYYDQGDQLYIGSVYGLYVIDVRNGKNTLCLGNKRGTQTFHRMAISSVYKDLGGNLWLGHSEGLTLWDINRDSLHFFDKERGLSDNIIRGITGDDHQRIWITSSNGLSIISVTRNRQGNLSFDFKNFNTKDGFRNNYFNNHALAKLKNGDIALGGTEGFTLVNSKIMTQHNVPSAKVVFTGLSIGNNPIAVGPGNNKRILLRRPMEQTDSLRLRYNDRLIALSFTTHDLISADKVKYAYKLEGFDDHWRITQKNKLEISSLPHSKYRLLIKACNSEGVWSEDVSTLYIVVTPPFYYSSWAYGIYGLLLMGTMAFGLYRIRKRHHRKLELHRLQVERNQKAQLNEMKLRFFSNINHDLRTPLTLITTPLQAMLGEKMEEGLRTKLQIMNRNAEQLLQLINSLLDFRKLDVGAETTHLFQGDFVRFVKELTELFVDYAQALRVGFFVSAETETMITQFDPVKVRKILANLLSNAFKFTPAKGSVDVHIYQDMDWVCVNVADTGRGISDQDKQHIFEEFYQATHSAEVTGSGIGLYIVKEYVGLLGGSIQVIDNQPEGSIFTLKLPMLSSEATEETYDHEEMLTKNDPEDTQREIHDERPVLLLVDDNKDFCLFIVDSLSNEYEVLVAYNGMEAMEQLVKHDVNIVISDVMMPVMDGIQLCNHIKSNLQWSHIPVILLTARSSEEYKMEGLEVGADDYLTKPFNLELLKLRIRKFLEWTKNSHLSFRQKMDISPSEITITPLDEQLLTRAISVVEEHISDDKFSVEDLGRELHLSRSHLYKKLMSITGRGPAEFIRTIRMKRSRLLLEQSQLQIAEIAYQVGYNSPKRFAVNFRNEFGMSPSQYLRDIKDSPKQST